MHPGDGCDSNLHEDAAVVGIRMPGVVLATHGFETQSDTK